MKIVPVRGLALMALAALILGCEKGSPQTVEELPSIAAAMPTIIVPANAAFVSRSGSADALSVVFRAAGQPDGIAAFYRNAFKPPVWRLVSDTRDREGAFVLYAEQDGPPLWVRIWADTANNGTFVRLTGAVVARPRDSASASPDTAASAPRQ